MVRMDLRGVEMTALTQSGGKIQAWESSKTWPAVNKVFNVFAFDYPNQKFTTTTQAPHERGRAYPQYPSVQFFTRGAPQLTWFEGTYDVPTGTPPNVNMCKYPKLVGPWKNGKRECLDPGRLTAAEKAAIARRQAEQEAAISREIAKQRDADGNFPVYTGPRVKGLDGLGATDLEVEATSKVKRTYRTTELALLGLFAAGFYLVLRN